MQNFSPRLSHTKLQSDHGAKTTIFQVTHHRQFENSPNKLYICPVRSDRYPSDILFLVPTLLILDSRTILDHLDIGKNSGNQS